MSTIGITSKGSPTGGRMGDFSRSGPRQSSRWANGTLPRTLPVDTSRTGEISTIATGASCLHWSGLLSFKSTYSKQLTVPNRLRRLVRKSLHRFVRN
jgi:hypothetical protein